MRGTTTRAVAVGLLGLGLAARVPARTLLVPGDFADIQAAIDAAADGDVVLVGPGRYAGPIEVRDKQVAVRSAAGPAATVLQGPDEEVGVVLSNGGELSGFTLINRNRLYSAAILCLGRGPVVRGNIIEGVPDDPQPFAHGLSGGNTDVLVEGNIFRRNTCFQGALVGVNAADARRPRIVNNLFIDSDCMAVEVAESQLLVANNTFVRNRVALGSLYSGRAATVRNNLFLDNRTATSIRPSFGDPVLEHNLFFGNDVNFGEWAPAPAAGNLFGDPRVVDAAGDDLHLLPGSAAIDAGLADEAPNTDFDGLPRPLDGDGDTVAAVDIGAFERAPADFPTFTPTPTPSQRPTPVVTPTSAAPSPFGPFPPGTTIFVAAANGGFADGSPQHPYRTIQAAVDSARAAAVVGVARGTYREFVRLRRGVSLRGLGPDQTTLDAGGVGAAVECADGSAIEGFTITNAAGRDLGAVVCGSSVVATIARNRFVANDSPAIRATQADVSVIDNDITANPVFTVHCPCDGIVGTDAALRIRGNRIDADDRAGNVSAVDLTGGRFEISANRVVGRLFVSFVSSRVPTPNRIDNNLLVSGNGFSEGINLAFSPEAGEVTNNTVVGGGGIFLQGGSRARLVSNVVAFGREGISLLGGDTGVVLRHNLVFGNVLAIPAGERRVANYINIDDPTGRDGNLSVDPQFVDRAAGDYRLACGSPAVDAGSGDDAVGPDFEGDPRAFDANGDGLALPDIGADEYLPDPPRPFRTLEVPGDFASIQAAVDAAAPCDTVRVANGTYRGSVRFGGKDVRLRSHSGAAATVIEGDGSAAVDLGPSGLLRGFTIRNRAAHGSGVTVHGAHGRVLDNILDGSGARFSGLAAIDDAAPVIERNVVRGNSCAAGQHAVAIVGPLARDAYVFGRFADNLVADNPGCTGVSASQGRPALVNNTIVRNRVGIDWVDPNLALEPAIGINNLIAYNETGLRSTPAPFSAADTRWRGNLFFGNRRAVAGIPQPSAALGNVSVDPRVVDPRGDYRLQAGSPAIDAGIDDRLSARDAERHQRPADGNGDGAAVVDIGAYEHGAAPPCAGDCTRDRQVTVDELVRIVGTALGEQPLGECPAADGDEDGRLAIDEIVRAVAAASRGCDGPVS